MASQWYLGQQAFCVSGPTCWPEAGFPPKGSRSHYHLGQQSISSISYGDSPELRIERLQVSDKEPMPGPGSASESPRNMKLLSRPEELILQGWSLATGNRLYFPKTTTSIEFLPCQHTFHWWSVLQCDVNMPSIGGRSSLLPLNPDRLCNYLSQ